MTPLWPNMSSSSLIRGEERKDPEDSKIETFFIFYICREDAQQWVDKKRANREENCREGMKLRRRI
jgi:hypothetical protein